MPSSHVLPVDLTERDGEDIVGALNCHARLLRADLAAEGHNWSQEQRNEIVRHSIRLDTLAARIRIQLCDN